MRRIMILAGIALGCTLTGCSPRVKSGTSGPIASMPGFPGAMASDLTGRTMGGKLVRLADYRGKTVMLNFFSPT